MYYIFKIGERQFIGQKGDKINLPFSSEAKEKETLELDSVLCTFDKDYKDINIGKSKLDTKLKLKILKVYKGDKMHIIKFKKRKRYSKKIGFRPKLMQVEIL